MSANVAWATGEVWHIALHKNGTRYSDGEYRTCDANLSANFGSVYSDIVYLAATEYIDIRIHHNQGAAVNIENNAVYNHFSVHRLS